MTYDQDDDDDDEEEKVPARVLRVSAFVIHEGLEKYIDLGIGSTCIGSLWMSQHRKSLTHCLRQLL